MSQPRIQLLQQARDALRRRDRRQAQRLLWQLARAHPDEYRAWLWLAGIVDDAQLRGRLLDKAVALRPDEPVVQQAVRWNRTQSAVVRPGRDPVPAKEKRSFFEGGRRLIWLVLIVLSLAATAGIVWAVGQTNATVEAIPADGGQPAIDSPGENIQQPTRETDSVIDLLPTEQPLLPNPTITATSASSSSADPLELPTATQMVAVLPAKEVARNSSHSEVVRPTWTPTSTPTATPSATPTPEPTATTPPPTLVPLPASSNRTTPVEEGERWIDVNLTNQSLAAYVGNELVFTTRVSTGLPQWPTVTGEFRIYLAYESQNMSGYPYGYDYYLPNVPHVMYFYEGYALHGAYWHNNFGTPQSHGCVNLSLPDAEWIWSFADIGTLVNVHY